MWIRTDESLFDTAHVVEFHLCPCLDSDQLMSHKPDQSKTKYMPQAIMVTGRAIRLVSEPMAKKEDAIRVIDEIYKSLDDKNSMHDMRWRNECRAKASVGANNFVAEA